MPEQKKHPEQKDDEFFVSNVSKNTEEWEFDEPDNFNYIGWTTKRFGQIAYDKSGNVSPTQVPVFVDKDEVRGKSHGPIGDAFKLLETRQLSLYP